MNNREDLTKNLDSETFRKFYYLKAELVDFCRANGLSTAGGKREITERIAFFLETGKVLTVISTVQKKMKITEIGLDMPVEENFVCSEKHRAFFKQHIGNSFSFHVAFQTWLKMNSGKTYEEAIKAYHLLLAAKKKGKIEIAKQFEYNTYIRDFFADNQGMTLDQAIACWNYKKQQAGTHAYKREDTLAIK